MPVVLAIRMIEHDAIGNLIVATMPANSAITRRRDKGWDGGAVRLSMMLKIVNNDHVI